MRVPKILAAYIVREVLQYSLLGFLVFASLMLTQNLLRTLEDLADAAGAATAGDLVRVAVLLFPVLATYAFPVAFLFGVLLAVGRLSSESEVLAMRACGLGMRALVVPVLGLSLVVAGITSHLMREVEPSVRQSLRRVIKEAATRNLTLEPGEFRAFQKRIVYARSSDLDGTLRGVVIWDKSNRARPFTVFAEEGRFLFDRDSTEVHLLLAHGDMHLEPEQEDRYRRISFETFDYSFDVSDFMESEGAALRPRDMSMEQIRAILKRLREAQSFQEIEDLRERDPRVYETQIHRRYAIPLAPVVFALLAVPLALRRVRGARSAGALLCVALAFAYYALLSLAEFLGQKTGVPPALALWLPNVVFLAVALPLLNRARRGES